MLFIYVVLQGNLISNLDGFEISEQMADLALAGNPITDFAELRKLSSLNRLKSLSLSDIHFGRCPIVEEKGYKEFILCFLRQVRERQSEGREGGELGVRGGISSEYSVEQYTAVILR